MTDQKIPYEDFVAALVKNPEDIYETLTAEKIDLLHGAVGVSGEAGELLDAIKKYVVYNKPLDRENVVEEISDCLFYLQVIMNRLGITREEALDYNVGKLMTRYEGMKYSDKAAQERADKEPGQ